MFKLRVKFGAALWRHLLNPKNDICTLPGALEFVPFANIQRPAERNPTFASVLVFKIGPQVSSSRRPLRTEGNPVRKYQKINNHSSIIDMEMKSVKPDVHSKTIFRPKNGPRIDDLKRNNKDTTNGGHFAEFSHFADRLKELVYPKATHDKPIYDRYEAAGPP